MTDPVAEAAAQLAAQAAQAAPAESSGIVAMIVEGMHSLEAKVEHLIHPDAEVGTAAAGESVPSSSSPAPSADSAASSATPMAIASAPTGSPVPIVGEPGNAAVVVVESVTAPATAEVRDVVNEVTPAGDAVRAPATAEGAGGAAAGESDASRADGTSTSTDTAVVVAGESTKNGELPNAAATPPAGAATDAAGDVPNAVSAVAAPTAEPASAPSASGASTTSPIAASSGEKPPLHTLIAEHLESIYTLARDHVAAAPAAAVADTSALKTHIGDILHRISNGMAVSEGELVTKLEALYRML